MIGPAVLMAALLLAGCSYGPPVDRSGFESAALMPDGRTLVIAYKVLRYRPATGIAAFPDGGVPRYLDDRVVIAAVPAEGGRPRVLQRIENRGVHGGLGVNLRAQDADPGHVLVLASEQPSTSTPSRGRWWRLNPADGRVLPYPDLEGDMRGRGRRLGSPEFGDVRVLDAEGALLIGARNGEANELWARAPGGDYRLVDAFRHFYGVRGDELYYWSGNEAVVRNWRTGTKVVTARYDPQARRTSRLAMDHPTVRALEGGRQDPTVGVSVPADGAAVTLGRRGPGGWTYEPVRIDLEPLRR